MNTKKVLTRSISIDTRIGLSLSRSIRLYFSIEDLTSYLAALSTKCVPPYKSQDIIKLDWSIVTNKAREN